MDSSHFASGEVLFNAKNRTQVLPSWGEKLSEACGSILEERQVEERLQDRHTLISELRVARKDQLAMGRWIRESNMVQLVQQTGTFWDHMGVETDIGRCLYPEEALYLIEMGELEVDYGGMPLSMQSAQAIMLVDCYHLDQYIVYAYLTRSGCKVVRHQPHLRFTRYEKQIRLDQHQTKKKKKKLKLKNEDSDIQEIKYENADKMSNKSLQSGKEKELEIIEDQKNMDDVLKDFYSCLGDEVENPSKIHKQTHTALSSQLTDERKGKEIESRIHDVYLENYEKKKKEYLDLFPSMLSTNVQVVNIEEAELYPENSVPQKKQYEISLDFLNYYCRYKDDDSDFVPHYHCNNRWKGSRGNFRGGNRHQGFSHRYGYDTTEREWDRGKQDIRYGNWADVRNEKGYDSSWDGGRRWENRHGDDSSYSVHRQFRKRRLDDDRNGMEGSWKVNKTFIEDAQDSYMCNSTRLLGENYDRSNIRGRGVNIDDYKKQTSWNSERVRSEGRNNRSMDGTVYNGNKDLEESYLGVDVNNRKANEYRDCKDPGSRKHPDWYQHDDRSSFSLQEDTNASSMPKNPTIDLSVVPPWKNKRRQRRRDRRPDTYPSYLVKLPVQVHSWKEYKSIVNSMSEDNMLMQGFGQALWRGPSTPLIKPDMATSLQNVWEKCSLFSESKNVQQVQQSLPQELHLTLHFDVYLPNAPYRKSSPPIPSKRVTVIRDGIVPSLKQIQEVTRRFPDEAPVVSAVIVSGEVRLYTVFPCMLHPPKPS